MTQILILAVYLYVIISIFRAIYFYLKLYKNGSELYFGVFFWPILLLIWLFVTVPKMIIRKIVNEIKD